MEPIEDCDDTDTQSHTDTVHTLSDQLVGEAIDLQAVIVDMLLGLSRVATRERTEGAPTQTAFALVFVGLAVGVRNVVSAVGAPQHRRRDQLVQSSTRAEVRGSGALGTFGVEAGAPPATGRDASLAEDLVALRAVQRVHRHIASTWGTGAHFLQLLDGAAREKILTISSVLLIINLSSVSARVLHTYDRFREASNQTTDAYSWTHLFSFLSLLTWMRLN